MRWLVWKEYGQNRPIMIVGAVLLVAPHLIVLIACWYRGVLSTPQLPELLVLSASYSVVLSQLTLGLLGGNAIASERVDRSAEFLAYLPVSRTRILVGKIMLALLIGVLIWGMNYLVIQLAAPEVWRSEYRFSVLIRGWLVGAAHTGLVFFSVGWLLSSRWESPTFPICGGLLAPAVIVLGIQTVAWTYEYSHFEVLWPWYQRTCPIVASVCFLAGTWYYLRRVEP